MIADRQLRQATGAELRALSSRIFVELARRDRGGEPNTLPSAVEYSLPSAGDSQVIESRPHEDGTLLLEERFYIDKQGEVKKRGPYWYFWYHQQGRQRKLYLGKTDTPGAVLAQKRNS